MSLLPSLLTSVAITCLVWLVAVFQPNIAIASDMPIVERVNKTILIKELPVEHKRQAVAQQKKSSDNFKFENVQIAGISQNISLNKVPTLWNDFNDNKTLQNSLKRNPSKVFVYYRDFSSSYESAMVSIGYDAKNVKSKANVINLPTSRFSSLLNKGRYNDIELKQAWQKIDYRKRILAVVEVHYLNTDNTVNSTEIFVSYN